MCTDFYHGDFTTTAKDVFLNKLKNSNITNLLNLDENADPNLNFDLFMKHFMNLKQECFLRKLVRFDKKKQKNIELTHG